MDKRLKLPSLETSRGKSQQQHGSGSCSMGCHTPTGNRTAAILQPKKDSSSPSESQSNSQSDVISDLMRMRAQEDGILLCECQNRLKVHCQCELRRNGNSTVTDHELLQFWTTRIPVRQKG